MLDLHKLHLFYTVAKLRNFTRAAEQLHMTQPTVSQQIAALESMLGLILIERDTRQMRLTAAGEALLPYAEKLMSLSEEALEAAHIAAGLAESTLRLGVGHTLATYLLPDVLSRFQRLYPQHQPRISVGNTSGLLAMVADGTIDLALVGSPAEHPDVIATPFMHDHLIVIIAPGDEWAERSFITVPDLLSRVFLTREPGSALHATIERFMGAEALTSKNVFILGENEAIKRSVEAGLGVALIQGIAVQREIAAGTLRAIPLQGVDDRRTYLVARPIRRHLPQAATTLLTLLAHFSQEPLS